MRLLLIRHGQTPNNVIGALDTARPGAGLTPLGFAQAAAIPREIAHEPIEAIHASPLVRTQLTAAPLGRTRGLDVGIAEGVEEISAGRLEMRRDGDAVGEYVDAALRWLSGDLAHAIAGGETGHEFFERFDAAVETIARAHSSGAAVVVSHGAAIRVWAASRAIDVDPGEVVRRRLQNTGLCVLEGDPDEGWRLERWHEEPLGGTGLEDESARDVTGEPDEADQVVANEATA